MLDVKIDSKVIKRQRSIKFYLVILGENVSFKSAENNFWKCIGLLCHVK